MMAAHRISDQLEAFYSELVIIISKHFIDDRIANPDLKEIYLVRLKTFPLPIRRFTVKENPIGSAVSGTKQTLVYLYEWIIIV